MAPGVLKCGTVPTRVQAVRRGSVTRRTHKAAHAVQVSFHPSALMY